MSHRANYVVIREGAAKAYYEQWGALGCIYQFAGGPADALAATQAAAETNELLDWAFAEGGYLIDFDQRKAIVFGMPGDPIDPAEFDELEGFDPAEFEESARLEKAFEAGPEEFLRSIAAKWAGWHLTWNDRGVDAFAAHLAARGITNIAVQPPSAREPSSSCEFQA